MSEFMDSARLYSERHSLHWLLQALDVSELCADSPTERANDAAGCDVSAKLKPLSTLIAEAVAAQGISEVDGWQEERMFGDLVNTSGGAAGAGASFFLAELHAALAAHFSRLTTGAAAGRADAPSGSSLHANNSNSSTAASHVGATSGLSVGSLQEGLSTSFALTRTWLTAAARFWRLSALDATAASAATDGQQTSPAAAPAAAVGEAFLHTLFGVAPAPPPPSGRIPAEAKAPLRDESRAAEEIALLFAKGHLPELPMRAWAAILELGREAMRVKVSTRLSASFKRLSAEAVTTRCLIATICDMAVAPALRELAARCQGSSDATSRSRSAFLPPPRVLGEIAANSALFAQDEELASAGEQLRFRLSIVFADSFFLHLLKPYPSLVANFTLASGR